MVISVRECTSTEFLNHEVNLEHSIRVAWKNSLSRNHSNSDVLPILNIFSCQLENDENIRILAKGNDLTFEFQGDSNTSQDKKAPPEIYECTRTSVNSDIADERALNDVSAPPPAMALVATMLTDFPNPPIETVIPVLTETTAPHNVPVEFPSSTSSFFKGCKKQLGEPRRPLPRYQTVSMLEAMKGPDSWPTSMSVSNLTMGRMKKENAWDMPIKKNFPMSEDDALKNLDTFFKNGFHRDEKERSRADIKWSTSKLSVLHLRIGTLSPNELF